MIDLLEDADGTEVFGFTGDDQVWEVPPGVSVVWLSLVGAISTALGAIQQPRGFACAPLEVEEGAKLRVRVGGRPEIVGLTEHDNPLLRFRWRMAADGGWNGGGDGGGGGATDEFGRVIHGQGGGGATTVHLLGPDDDPMSVLGELVAVAPGAGGNAWVDTWLAGIDFRDSGGPTYDADPRSYLLQRFHLASAAVSFAGEEVPAAESPEMVSLSYGPIAGDVSHPLTTPRTRAAVAALPEPWWDWGGTFDSTAVTLGNGGESFQGGHGRIIGGTWGTPGGGGGYGGGASGAYIEASGHDSYPFTDGTFTVRAVQGARYGGMLLPVARPFGWSPPALIAPGATLLTAEAGGISTPVRYLPDATSFLDPFDVLEPGDVGETIDTGAGHGSAAVQWMRRGGWHVGRVGWGRNDGW